MIFGDKYVFLELAKTGSTYARYVLINLDESNYETIGKKHNVYNSLSSSERKIFDTKVKVASIRNPFDWYVSLYAFGCEHRGGLYTWTQIRPDILSVKSPAELFKVVLGHIKFRKHWKEVFSDVNSVSNFEKFLNLLFTDDPYGPGFRYKLGKTNRFIGYYSYDYFRMCTYNFDENSEKLTSFDKIVEYHDNNFIVDIMLRNESLRDNLMEFADQLCTGKDEMLRSINSKPKKSRTATKRNTYKYYYTSETKKLVMEKDRFIFERYGYEF